MPNSSENLDKSYTEPNLLYSQYQNGRQTPNRLSWSYSDENQNVVIPDDVSTVPNMRDEAESSLDLDTVWLEKANSFELTLSNSNVDLNAIFSPETPYNLTSSEENIISDSDSDNDFEDEVNRILKEERTRLRLDEHIFPDNESTSNSESSEFQDPHLDPSNEEHFFSPIEPYAEFIIKKLPQVWAFHNEFGGLCEIACNLFIMKDRLDYRLHHKQYESSFQFFDSYLELIDKKLLKSHISVYPSFLDKTRFFITKNYKHAVGSFPFRDEISPEDLAMLTSLENNHYYKIVIHKRTMTQGHSLLVKRIGDKFALFDPAQGAFFNLNQEKLGRILEESFRMYVDYKSVLVLNGTQYMQEIMNQPSPEESAQAKDNSCRLL